LIFLIYLSILRFPNSISFFANVLSFFLSFLANFQRFNMETYPRPFLPEDIKLDVAVAIFNGNQFQYRIAHRDEAINMAEATQIAMSINEDGIIYRNFSMEKDSAAIPPECQLNLSDNALEIYENSNDVKMAVTMMTTPCAAAGLNLLDRQIFNTIAFIILNDMYLFNFFKAIHTNLGLKEVAAVSLPTRAFVAWASSAISFAICWQSDSMMAQVALSFGDSIEDSTDALAKLLAQLLFSEAGNLADNKLFLAFLDIHADATETDLTQAQYLSIDEIKLLSKIKDDIVSNINLFNAYHSFLFAH